jgi:hypothetical protein
MLQIGIDLLTLKRGHEELHGLKLVLLSGHTIRDTDFLASFTKGLRQGRARIASYPEGCGIGTIMLIHDCHSSLQLTVTAELARKVQALLADSASGLQLSDLSESSLHILRQPDGSIEIASVRFFRARFKQQCARRSRRAA